MPELNPDTAKSIARHVVSKQNDVGKLSYTQVLNAIASGTGFNVWEAFRENAQGAEGPKRFEQRRRPASSRGLRADHGLDDLQITATYKEKLKSFLNIETGIVLFGGPTGTGKTTTWQALVNHLTAIHGRSAISLESPPEKELRNVEQFPAWYGDEADAVPAYLQGGTDPIVIGTGLRSDFLETIADMIKRALNSGHTVWLELPAADAATAIQSLRRILPDQLALDPRTVRGVVAHHTLRPLCDECAIPAEKARDVGLLDPGMYDGLDPAVQRAARTANPRGCLSCQGKDPATERLCFRDVVRPDATLMDQIQHRDFTAARRRLSETLDDGTLIDRVRRLAETGVVDIRESAET